MSFQTTLVTSLVILTFYYESSSIFTEAQVVNVTFLYPETLSDSVGNTADRYSNISYVDAPMKSDYLSSGKGADDVGAIGLLYDFAGSVVDTSLPGGLPLELINKTKNGKFVLGDDWKKIVVDYLGYVIAVAVGIVFFFVFPIVGICFCCCRCCGRCGGRRVIKAEEDAGYGDNCGRRAAMCILAVFTVMALAGSVLMFITNSNLSTSLKDLRDKDIDKLDDITDFFNSTVQQAEQLITANFNFTLEVVFRDLDNIGFLLGTPIRDHVLINTGLGVTYDGIDSLDNDARILDVQLQVLVESRHRVLEKSELFYNFTLDMNTTVEDLAKNNPQFNTFIQNKREFVTNFSADQLPDETFNRTVLHSFVSQGIGALTAESKQNLNDIPERVQNDTSQQRSDLRKEVNTYTDDIMGVIEKLKSMRSDVMDGIDFDNIKEKGKKYVNTAKDYDQYRWYGGLGLACVMTVAVLFLTFGMLFGLFGGNASVNPAKRGGLSNAGGNMLIVGVAITFIFGSFMMLLTTILFAVGAPVKKFGCGVAEDLSTFDKLLDDYSLFGSSGDYGSWLGNKVFSGKNVTLTLSGVMDSCKNGETVYNALKLEEAKVVDLAELTDYKKKFNIENKLDNTVINFDGINITTGPVMTFIDFLKTFDINYDDYNKALSVNPVQPSKDFLDVLIQYNTTNRFSNPSEQRTFEDMINYFRSNISIVGAALESSINATHDAVKNIRHIIHEPQNNTLRNKCDELERSLKDIEQNLSTNAAKAFTVSVKNFETRLTNVLDQFIAAMVDSVKNKIGVCLPLWNLYSDVVVYGVCSSLIGALTGWWCAFGWTIFFLVASLIPAVKLSKHLRRMTLSPELSPRKSNGINLSSSHHFQNKVYHSDKANGMTNW